MVTADELHHGYPNCECDLAGGDLGCKIKPPYQTLSQKYINLLAENQKLKDLLIEIREAALFVDDDDVICFIQEIPVSVELFERICQSVR